MFEFSRQNVNLKKSNQTSSKTVIKIKDFPVETANELEKLEFHHFKNKLNFRAKICEIFTCFKSKCPKNPEVPERSTEKAWNEKKINYFLAMNRVFDLKQIPGLNQSFDIAKGRLESRL